MNKICTSIEQSKKLLELGIDVNTADMRYSPLNPDIPWVWVGKPLIEKDAIPAWSLTALLELIPKDENIVSDLDFGHYDDMCNYVAEWCINYVDMSEGEENPTIKLCSSENPLDAVFDMICWLKESKII